MNLATINTPGPYMVALQSPKVLQMKISEAKQQLLAIVLKTFYEAGQNVPGETEAAQQSFVKTMVNGLYDELGSFSFMGIEEVRIAFKNGVRGEYGEYFGLNIKTFYQWLKGWQYDEKRKAAREAIKKANETEYPPVMTPGEAELEWRKIIIRQFKHFKATGTLDCMFPKYLFDTLQQKGLIQLTNAEKDKILAVAYKHTLESKKLQRLRPKNRKHLSELTDFIRRAESNTLIPAEKEEVKQEARLMAIRQYYEGIEELMLE